MKYDFILIYFALFNIIGAVINIVDKRRAQKGKWRIKESTLWSVAILGGAPMSYITMKLIRHKTNHKSFMIIMPVLSVLDIIAFIYLLFIYI